MWNQLQCILHGPLTMDSLRFAGGSRRPERVRNYTLQFKQRNVMALTLHGPEN